MAEPPLDPETIARTAKTVSDIYSDAVSRMLQMVTERMARGIDEPGWAEAKLLDLVGLRADAQAVVNDLATSGPPAVQKAIEEAAEAGRTAAVRQLRTSLSPSTNTRAVEVLARETVQRVSQSHLGILRSVEDEYRKVVAEVSAPGVVTGIEGRRAATQRALNRWADLGVKGFRDSAGRNWELTSYAEMATRTASGRAMVDARLEVYVEDGRSLVIVSDAPQECKLCRPWEGKILSISGDMPKGTRLDDGDRVAGTVADARRDGLLHPNCRHDLRPYIVGLTRPFKGTEDPEGDQARQTQRKLERDVRRWKNREAVALDDRSKRIAVDRRKDAERRLADHVRDNDLKRLRYREGASSREPSWEAPVDRTKPSKVAPTPSPAPSSSAPRKPVKAADTLASLPGPNSRAGRAARQGLESIDKVHRVPPARTKAPVKSTTSQRFFGRYQFRTDNGEPVDISLATNHGEDHMSGTFAHEFGHYMDHQLLGRPGEFLTSKPDGPMQRVLDAITSSTEIDRLRNAKRMGTRGADYFLDPAEMWARAYAQWIADRSGDTAMMKNILSRRRGKGLVRFSQWAESDFGPIADAIDDLMRANGLMP